MPLVLWVEELVLEQVPAELQEQLEVVQEEVLGSLPLG
jgi:hypothetical protein